MLASEGAKVVIVDIGIKIIDRLRVSWQVLSCFYKVIGQNCDLEVKLASPIVRRKLLPI